MYGSIEGWRAYATARGNSAPSGAVDVDATAALTRASDYVRLRYAANLLSGYDAETFAPAGHSLPLTEEAAYIAASLELETPDFFTTTFTPDQRKVLTGASKIKWTPIGEGSQKYGAMPVSTQIDALFEPYIIDRNASEFMFSVVGKTA